MMLRAKTPTLGLVSRGLVTPEGEGVAAEVLSAEAAAAEVQAAALATSAWLLMLLAKAVLPPLAVAEDADVAPCKQAAGRSGVRRS